MNSFLKIASTSTVISLLAFSSHAWAADAVVGEEPEPPAAPESFDQGRFYISGFGGVAFNLDQELSGAIGGAPQTVDLDYETGFFIGGAIGHNFGDIGNGVGLRGELELSYNNSDIDAIGFSGNGPANEINVDGDFTSTNLFANALLDLPSISDGLFTPYVGGGVGVAFTDIDASYGPGFVLDSDDENFALQGIVGLSTALTDNVDFFVEGRYQRTFDVETPRLAPTGALTGTVEDDIDQFGVLGGLRWTFN